MQATESLTADCMQELQQQHSRVHCPAALQEVECSLPAPAFQVRLSNTLLSGTVLRDMEGYQLGWVDAITAGEADGDQQVLQVQGA